MFSFDDGTLEKHIVGDTLGADVYVTSTKNGQPVPFEVRVIYGEDMLVNGKPTISLDGYRYRVHIECIPDEDIEDPQKKVIMVFWRDHKEDLLFEYHLQYRERHTLDLKIDIPDELLQYQFNRYHVHTYDPLSMHELQNDISFFSPSYAISKGRDIEPEYGYYIHSYVDGTIGRTIPKNDRLCTYIGDLRLGISIEAKYLERRIVKSFPENHGTGINFKGYETEMYGYITSDISSYLDDVVSQYKDGEHASVEFPYMGNDAYIYSDWFASYVNTKIGDPTLDL